MPGCESAHCIKLEEVQDHVEGLLTEFARGYTDFMEDGHQYKVEIESMGDRGEADIWVFTKMDLNGLKTDEVQKFKIKVVVEEVK